jgi:hypothetical protein
MCWQSIKQVHSTLNREVTGNTTGVGTDCEDPILTNFVPNQEYKTSNWRSQSAKTIHSIIYKMAHNKCKTCIISITEGKSFIL